MGTYPIVAAAGTLSAANYTFSFTNGTLTITASVGSATTLSVAPATIMYGDTAVLTAVVAPAGATGLVRFFESTSNLQGSASLDGTGTAVLPVSILPAGTHNITADYTGDSNVPASTSNTVPLTVTKLTAPGGGPALTVKVNDATRTAAQPNPPFTYSTSGTLVNGDTYATAVTGTPTYTTSAGTLPGTFVVTVSGLTSANYTIQFLPGTLTVVQSPTATTLVASPAYMQYGDAVTLTATVAPGAVTGNVSFFDGAALLGQATVSGGVATLATTTLKAGTHTISAVYNGDGTYATSESAPQTVTVAKRTAVGGGPALIATVQDESRPFGAANPQFTYVPSGTLVNGDTYAAAITGRPVYSTTATPTSPVGTTWPIDVNGLGSQNYVIGIVQGILTIVANSTATTLAVNPTSTQYGDPVKLTATVTPVGATGLVAFVDGSTVLGTGTVSGGVATLTTTAIHAGSYTITAVYLGDGNYSESTSGPVSLMVVPRGVPVSTPALTVTVGNATRAYLEGDPAFGYNVSGALVNGDTYATAVTGIPVYSTTSTVLSPPGSYSITVAGLNSRDYLLAFVPGTLTVTKANPIPTVTASPNPSASGSPVTIMATLPPGATGTVTFYDGTTPIGTATINNGTATITVPSFSQGTHSITANYGGDANFAPAVSAPISLVITVAADFAVTNKTGPQLIPPGASASYNISITSLNAPFTNVVTLTATNLPPGATYTYTPPTVTPGNTGASSTLAISTPKQSASVVRPKGTLLALGLLLPFATLRRGRGKPRRLLLWLIALAVLGTSVGCGGGYFSQPQQTYTITVTATSGGLVHSTTVTLTVQ